MSKWEMVKLGEVFDLQMGKTPSRDNPGYWTGGSNKWVSIADISAAGKYIDHTKEAITDAAVAETGIKVVPEGTVIMSFKLSIGKACITAQDIYTNEAIMAFIDRDIYEVDTSYLYHLLKNRDWSIGVNKAAKGVTLNKATLGDIEIPLPLLETQKHIAHTLDTTAELLAMRRRHLAELDSLIKATFFEMFGDPMTNEKGWEVRTLRDLSSLITKGASPGWQGINYTDDQNQVLFVTSENVREGYMDLSRRKYVESQINLRQSRSILEYGDLLINLVGASIGRAAIFYSSEVANINQAVALVRCNKDVCLTYLCHYLNSPKALQMYSEMQVDVARANLSLRNIGDLSVVYPPLPLQTRFAELVTRIEEQKTLVRKAIDETQHLFDSLMSEFFE